MKKVILLSAAFLILISGSAGAQVVGSSKLIWDQPNVASLAEANSLSYKYYPDGAVAGITLTSVICSGTTTITCQSNWPAFTPGNHTLTLSATNIAGESAKSSPFAFVFVIIPSAPVNIRIG